MPRLGRSAVHITGRLCDRDGEAFRSSRGRHRPGGSEAGDLEKQRSEQQRQQTSERTRGIATPRLLRLSRGGRRQPRSNKGLSGWQGQQRLQRLDAPRQSFRKSGPVPAVSESPSSCWCRQHDLTEPPGNTALRPPLPRAIRARPAGCSLSPTTPVGLARTSDSWFLVLWTLS